MKYSEIMKEKIRLEYKPYEYGYKKQAKKYGLKRDTVRAIILRKKRTGIRTIMPETEELKFKSIEEELEYYKTAAMYFKAYSKRFEINMAEDLKKSRFEGVYECKEQGAKIKTVCGISKIACSSLYYFNSHSQIKEEKDPEVLTLIKSLDEKEQKLGFKVKAKILSQKEGRAFNHKRIARICRKYGLLSEIRKSKVPSGYYKKLNEKQKNLNGNILNRDFRTNRPGKCFVTDISYFKVIEGWLYLCVIKDLFNCEVVASLCSKKCDAELATETLKQLRVKNII